MQKWVKRLAVLTAVGMFVVLVQGSLVTTTGSEEGCGKSWPLCNGEFVPSYAVESMIEYMHRFVTGIEGFLILGTAIGALYYWRDRLEIRILVPLMIGFLFLQAGLGAAAVMWPQTPEIMALHFGISLVAFASVLLTAIFLYEKDGRDKLRDLRVPASFSYAVWGLLGATYLVVYWGAYLRHNDASLACRDWPLCDGEILPALGGETGMVIGHRFSAGLLALAIFGLVYWASKYRDRRPDLFWGSVIAAILIISQSLTGAFIVWSELDIFATMSHGMFVSLFFGAMAYLGLHTLPRPASAVDPARRQSTRVDPPTQEEKLLTAP